MPYNPALSYTGLEQLLNAQEIRSALGQPGLSPTQLQNYAQGATEAMYSPWIQTQAEERRFGQSLAERQREFDIQQREAEKERERQQQMQAISGATQLAGLGTMGYLGYRMLQPAVETAAGTAVGQAVAQSVPSIVPMGAQYVPPGAVEGAIGGVAQAGATGVTGAAGETGIMSTLSVVPSWGWAGLATGALTGLTTGNWGRAATTGGGAAAGAAIGSAIAPGIGTVVGGFVGGLAGDVLGGGTVICTELYRQRLISKDLYDTVHKYTDTLPLTTKIGYYTWALGVVQLMKRSRLFSKLVHKVTIPIMNDIASRVSTEYKPNKVGRALYSIGEKLCTAIGSIRMTLIVRKSEKQPNLI